LLALMLSDGFRSFAFHVKSNHMEQGIVPEEDFD
jgi:hypothetical protein